GQFPQAPERQSRPDARLYDRQAEGRGQAGGGDEDQQHAERLRKRVRGAGQGPRPPDCRGPVDSGHGFPLYPSLFRIGGGAAQLVRAAASYSACRGFDSLPRYQLNQMVSGIRSKFAARCWLTLQVEGRQPRFAAGCAPGMTGTIGIALWPLVWTLYVYPSGGF